VNTSITLDEHNWAVNNIASFYQGKRAMLKKQVTHWIGKFMIVKHENNRLREKVRSLEAEVLSSLAQKLVIVARCDRITESQRLHIKRLTDITERCVCDSVERYHEAQEALVDADKENVGC
jgi:hypothetical protein